MTVKSRLLGAAGIVAVASAIVGVSARAVRAQSSAQAAAGAIEVAPMKADDLSLRYLDIRPVERTDSDATPAATWRAVPETEFVARNATLRSLLILGYRGEQDTLYGDEIQGAPSWVDSASYDIDVAVTGSAPALSTRQALASVIQMLLVQRFQLAVHFEEREAPFFALIIENSRGSVGPNLRRSLGNCVESLGGASFVPNAAARGTMPPPLRCGGLVGTRTSIDARSIVIPVLVQAIRAHLSGVNIFDRTGLADRFDVTLRWTAPPGVALPDATVDSITDEHPVVRALTQQLGLALERHDEPHRVLVVDNVRVP
jgi:uncharacterized protein (TIGR03435 family)